MNYRIDSVSGSPAYLQLYELLKRDIIQGVYPFQTRLPSKRLIAAECCLSLSTVEHAYALLCEEGYAESRERSGYFVSFCSDVYFSSGESYERSAPSPLLPSSAVSDAPSFPFSVYAKTVRRVLSDYGENILERSPGKGCPVLRRAVARYLSRSRGIHVTEEQVVIGSGAEYLYGLLVELFGRDAGFGLETPSYEKIESVYRASGAVYHLLPLGVDGIESTALTAAETMNLSVLHVTPYRSFPSGVTASASKRHEYIRWAEKRGRFLVEDDYESEFTISQKAEETLFALSDRENVIYMNSFTKTLSPGIRVAYLVLPRLLLPTFDRRLGFYSCTVPTFEQYLLAELINSGDFERHINRVRRAKRREKQKQKQ